MARPRTELAPTYGTLTVINDPPGSMKTLVRCKCGVEKWVLRSNLTSERISSCGAPSCRSRKRTTTTTSTVIPMSAAAMRGLKAPNWLPVSDVARVWEQLENKGKPMHVAMHYGVHVQTLYNWIKVVRAVGGLENYLGVITGKKAPAEAAAVTQPEVHGPTPLAAPGALPTAPPPFYRP